MKKPSLKHIPLGLLCVYLVRSLVLNSINLNEVLLIGVLAALTAFYEMQLEGKAIKELNEQIKKLSDNDKQQEDIIKDIRNIISTMKVSSGIRNVR
jgi:hypothetical protein